MYAFKQSCLKHIIFIQLFRISLLLKILCLHPGECKHPPHETLIKERDHTAHAKDSYNGSNADSDQMMRENHADRDGDADIQQIEAILRKANRAVNTVRDRLHDSVSGIRDNSHIQRHGSADSREDDTASQRKELQRQRVRVRNPCRKQIHKTGKDQAERPAAGYLVPVPPTESALRHFLYLYSASGNSRYGAAALPGQTQYTDRRSYCRSSVRQWSKY